MTAISLPLHENILAQILSSKIGELAYDNSCNIITNRIIVLAFIQKLKTIIISRDFFLKLYFGSWVDTSSIDRMEWNSGTNWNEN